MRKISFLLACCMLFSLFSFRVGAMSKEKVTVIVDGEMVAFDEEPFIESGRVLVPVRKFMEALGAEVTWDGRTRKVTVHKNQTTIAFFIDSTVAAIDGKAIALDVPARIQRGRTFVPLRFLSENLDFTVL